MGRWAHCRQTPLAVDTEIMTAHRDLMLAARAQADSQGNVAFQDLALIIVEHTSEEQLRDAGKLGAV